MYCRVPSAWGGRPPFPPTAPPPNSRQEQTVIEVTADTCDACGARAYLYAEHDDWPIGLAYCAHHGTEYLPELTKCGATVIDLRHMVQA